MGKRGENMILYQDQIIDRKGSHIDIEDRGYQFGDGIYEVIRVYNKKMFMSEDHFKRLERSARELYLKLPYSIDQLESHLTDLIETNNLVDGIVYLQVTRGVAPRQHQLPQQGNSILTAYTKELSRPIHNLKSGIRCVLTEDIRWLRCDIKSLNLLGNVLAKQKAVDANCNEAILHRGDIITEGSSTNVFGIKDGALYTHPLNNYILPGITRIRTLDLATELNIPIIEESMTVKSLLSMEEVFVTSTTVEVMPVIQINDHIVGNGEPGQWTKSLQDAFLKRITIAI